MFITFLRLFLISLFIGLQYQLWYGENGLFVHRSRLGRLLEIQQQNESLTQRNERLRQEIKELQIGGETLEEHVRKSFFWISQKEILFIIEESY